MIFKGREVTLEDAIKAVTDLLKVMKKASEDGIDGSTFSRVCRDKVKAAGRSTGGRTPVGVNGPKVKAGLECYEVQAEAIQRPVDAKSELETRIDATGRKERIQ